MKVKDKFNEWIFDVEANEFLVGEKLTLTIMWLIFLAGWNASKREIN